MPKLRSIILYQSLEKGAKATLNRTLSLAKAHEAELTVVDVMNSESAASLGDSFSARDVMELRREVEEQRERGLAAAQAAAERDGVNAKTKLLFGEPFLEIIRETVQGGHDLVIKTAHGEGGWSERLFGSVALHLMRKCPVPVWVMKPTRRRKYFRILAAVDPQPDNPNKQSVNRRILDWAATLAETPTSRVHILTAWNVYGETILTRSRGRISRERLRNVTETAKAHHERNLEELLKGSPLDGMEPRVHLRRGEPADVIVEAASKTPADLLIMGTVSRAGIAGLFIGNTAESVLQRVDCSVLTVKPEGFRTPVHIEGPE